MNNIIEKLKKDKKRLGILVFGVAVLFFCIFDAITQLNNTPNETVSVNKGDITVLSTSFPSLDMTRNILGEKVNGTVLIEDYDDVRNYEPTPIDIKKINDADIFVYNGDYLEPWVADVIKNEVTNDSLIVVDTSKSIQFTKNNADKNMVKIKEIAGMSIEIDKDDIKTDDEIEKDKENKKEDEKKDPNELSSSDQEAFVILEKMMIGNQAPKDSALYKKLDELRTATDEHVSWTVKGKKYTFYIGKVLSFYQLDKIEDADAVSSPKLSSDDIYYWMSLKNAEQMVTNIAEQISQQSSNLEEQVTKNATNYNKEILNLLSKYKGKKSIYPLIITNKVNISSLFAELELDYATLYGTDMENDPSTNELFSIVEAVDYLDITSIYTDETGGNSFDKKISQDSGAELLVLDSMTLMPSQKVIDDYDYLETMKANLEALNLK